MKKSRFLRKLVSVFLASAMILNGVTASAEKEKTITDTKIISGYECYSYGDGKYYTVVDDQEILVLVIGKTEEVTDPTLLAQLNSLLDDNISLYNYPASWPNSRDYDISTINTYIERVNLDNGAYYSPAFNISIGNTETLYLTVDYLNNLGTETKYIPIAVHYYTTRWVSQEYTFAFNEVINRQDLFTGTSAGITSKVCFKMSSTLSNGGVFSYTVSQGR